MLVGVGSGLAYASMERFGETRYDVTISAPFGVAWHLWIPGPDAPMDVEASPGAVVAGEISTYHGVLTMATGSGPATIHFTQRWSALRVTPLEPKGFVDLSGREGLSGFWVFRMSTDATEPIQIESEGYVRGQQLRGRFFCGTSFYGGPLADGWNLLPFETGECTLTSANPIPFVAGSVAMIAVGAVPIAMTALRRFRIRVSA